MILIRCIKTKLTDSKFYPKLFLEDGKRYLYLAPPFLLDDYEPVALGAYKTGVLKVV